MVANWERENMSYLHTHWAASVYLGTRTISPTDRSVLVHLAMRMNGALHGPAKTSLARIASDLGFSQRTVQRSIKRLEDCQLLEVCRDPRSVSHYWALMPEDQTGRGEG